MQYRVLLVRDPTANGRAVEDLLPDAAWSIKHASAEDYQAMFALEPPETVLVQIGASHDLARDVLSVAQQFDEHLPVLILAGEGSSVETAVELVKGGAHDYLRWPVEANRFRHLLEHAVKLYRLTKRVFFLEQQMGWPHKFAGMLGQSAKMQEVFQLIRTVAPTNATVLLTGESGTGKELVARAIHQFSLRAEQIFMDINCGAIPENLLENELFGHERGAFTGAERRYTGCCERAHQGTLFLDEICEMPLALQVKILRLLQERSFMRVGGSERITVDLRFVAATNRDVQAEVQRGHFREDLYYRLNVVPIHIPPLRERAEDVPVLARAFMERFAQKLEKPFVDIAPDAMGLLCAHTWPGNVRELENVIERVVVLHNDTRVKPKHLPPQLQKSPRVAGRPRAVVNQGGDASGVLPLDMVERYAIESALEKCVWNVGEAAKRLRIGQATLYRKIRQYGLRQ
ncbi:MAG: sigma-54-dependent Fis family transcriptional regulator [Deltaproteobacteria bacterium]|nr:sigma-54-dependent Fis family transcriptional regulator [Deltaproteobacteria bacterium]